MAAPKEVDGKLPRPETVAGFYRDISVFVSPSPGNYRIANLPNPAKLLYNPQYEGVRREPSWE